MQVDIVNNVDSKILIANGGHKTTYSVQSCSNCIVLIDQANGAAAAAVTMSGLYS